MTSNFWKKKKKKKQVIELKAALLLEISFSCLTVSFLQNFPDRLMQRSVIPDIWRSLKAEQFGIAC